MSRLILCALLAACSTTTDTSDKDAKSDTDTSQTDTDVGDTTDETDTDVTWDTNLPDTGGPGGGNGGNQNKDEPIVDAPLDGTWTGDFLFTNNVELFGPLKDPKCAGTISIVVDGANPDPRHVVVKGDCAAWDPNYDLSFPGVPVSISSEYGPLTITGVGSYDEDDTSTLVLDMSFSASTLGSINVKGEATFADDTLTVAIDDQVPLAPGLPKLGKVGPKVDATLARE